MNSRVSHASGLLALSVLVYGLFVIPQAWELLNSSLPASQSAAAINVSVSGVRYTYLTPTSGGSITDAQGNVWAFMGGTTGISGDTCDIKYSKNGQWAYGNGGATHLIIYNGVLHQKSCIYGWYQDNGSGFIKDSVADAAALNTIIAASPLKDVVLAPGKGTLVDATGATWKIDINEVITRNGAQVGSKQYPSAWQTTVILYLQSDQRVYVWGSDNNWYYYDDASGYLVPASVAPTSSNPASFTPIALTAPTITAQPSSQTVNVGESITFSVAVSGTEPFKYRWYRNSVAVTGATNASLTIASAQTSDAGSYTVRVTNSVSSVTSNKAVVTVMPLDVTLSPGSGSVTDATGAVWKIDSNQFITRNGNAVGSRQYPGAWQTTTLVYRAADQRVYVWGSDSNWYYYDNTSGYLTAASVAPVSTNPAPFSPIKIVSTSTDSSTTLVVVPTTSGFVPPGRVVAIAACNGDAAHDTGVITNALAAAGAGNTAKFVAGTSYNCVVNSFAVPSGTYVYADPSARVTITASAANGGTQGAGNTIIVSSNAIVNGSYAIQSCNIVWTIANQTHVTIGNVNIGRVGCGYDRIQADGSTGAVIKNNNFSNTGKGSPIGSGTIGAYNPTGLVIDGNVFDTSLGNNDFITIPQSAGVNTQITRNVFLRASAAVMEIGFGGTSSSMPTQNLTISNNWAANMNCGAVNACQRGGYGIGLVYSIPVNGPVSGTVITNNYADGTTPGHYDNAGVYQTRADMGIEVQGDALIANNVMNNFTFGIAGAYSCPTSGSIRITNNTVSNSALPVSMFKSCPGMSVVPNPQATTPVQVPAQPTRQPWGGQN